MFETLKSHYLVWKISKFHLKMGSELSIVDIDPNLQVVKSYNYRNRTDITVYKRMTEEIENISLTMDEWFEIFDAFKARRNLMRDFGRRIVLVSWLIGFCQLYVIEKFKIDGTPEPTFNYMILSCIEIENLIRKFDNSVFKNFKS